MAYQSLYRRFRPQRFDEVRGQQHLVTALRNAVREDRAGHAYLFSGPRGTGKTTTARILAKALNCPNLADGEPCGACESCRAITEGSSFDVFELDAASNNGVDAIRDLVDRASQGSPGRRKVYILDEVHMLSAGASNALLKTLEEPPDHVVFVLATTDPQKVLPTIKSRTQHYEVHLLSAEELTDLVEGVIAEAGLDVPEGTLEYVLRAGGGSARDTLSALEQVVAYDAVPGDLGVVDELIEALCEADTGRALVGVDAGIGAGQAPRTLGEALMARLRDVFLASVGGDLSRLSEVDRTRVAGQAERLGARRATHALEVLGDAFQGIREAPDPRIPLEVALVRLTRPELDVSPTALLGRIERLEHQLEGGAVPAPAAPAAAPVEPAPPAGSTRPAEGAAAPASAIEGPPPEATEPEPETQPTTPPPAAPGGGSGADAAREALAAKRATKGGGGRGPRRGADRTDAPADAGPPPEAGPRRPPRRRGATRPAETEAADEPTAAAPSAAPTGDAPAGDAPAEAVGEPVATEALPTRDELVVAWGDVVLESLPQRAKVRMAGGRFLEVADGVAVFGLPNEHHQRRCEEVRPQVEEALAAHFGRPVPLRLVVDAGAEAPRRPGDAPPVAPGGDDDDEGPEHIDVGELEDADDAAVDAVSRIAEVFPGAERVEEQQP